MLDSRKKDAGMRDQNPSPFQILFYKRDLGVELPGCIYSTGLEQGTSALRVVNC